MNPQGPFAVSLDVGSSSIRALLYDAAGIQMEGYGANLPVKIRTTPDGGAELHPDELLNMVLDCLDELHRQVDASGLTVVAVTGCAFMHGLLGVDAQFQATTPVVHLFDTRAETYVARLPDSRARTGCPPHSSYWPAKLLWLAEARPNSFAATSHWMSFPELILAKLFGRPRASLSMASATGLWNHAAEDWDSELLALTGIRREQLATRIEMDLLERDPRPEYRKAWPAFSRASWFPLLGDGIATHIGSGCTSPGQYSLTVGTTGAVRAVFDTEPSRIERGLWRYRADRSSAMIGGALSSGGKLLEWLKHTLQLPRDLEARLDQAAPGTHGLSVLPFLAGERTPYWRGDLRGAITGLSYATEPFDILRAALESASLGFRQVYELLAATAGAPGEIIVSGGALLRSAGWTQMIADALGQPVTPSTILEPASRGAAMWALAQTGTISSLAAISTSMGATFEPRPAAQAAFDRMAEERARLLERLYGPSK